jgi:hypothetical protein
MLFELLVWGNDQDGFWQSKKIVNHKELEKEIEMLDFVEFEDYEVNRL